MIGQFTHVTLATGHSKVSTGREIDAKVTDRIWPLVASVDFSGEADLGKGMMLKRQSLGFGGNTARCWTLRYKDHKDWCVQMMLCADVSLASQCWDAIKRDNICAPGLKMPQGCFLATAINPVPLSSLPDGMMRMLADMEQCVAWSWLRSRDNG